MLRRLLLAVPCLACVCLAACDGSRLRRLPPAADENGFQYVKDLHHRNLIVPPVGNFAGAHALRRVAAFMGGQGGRVRVFYGSNVEVYLSREQSAVFCGTLAALPQHARSWFIGNKGMQPLRTKVAECAADSADSRQRRGVRPPAVPVTA